ncbi:MAG: hypothetical protein R3A80_08970 [Bdellovibrionota bacterium]
MAYSRSLRRLFFCALLSVSLLTPQNTEAGGGGNGMAMVGKMLGGVLVAVGVSGLFKNYGEYQTFSNAANTNCPNPYAATACAAANAGKTKEMKDMAINLLEIAGGAAALMSNSGTEADTRAGGDLPKYEGYTPESAAGAGLPAGTNLPDVCASMPGACKIDPETNRPQIALPPKEEMMAKLSSTFAGQAVNPDGLSLDEALSDLDKKYDAAADAVAAFNSASDSGAFDAAMNGEGAELASTGQPDGDAGIGEGLNTGRGPASGSAGGGLEAFTLPTGETTDWVSLLNKKKSDRGTLSRTKAVGMNLEDARSGRLLTLFERVTRTLRGTRDRDILLAKVEWTRKSVLKTQNKARAKPKLAVSTEKN